MRHNRFKKESFLPLAKIWLLVVGFLTLQFSYSSVYAQSYVGVGGGRDIELRRESCWLFRIVVKDADTHIPIRGAQIKVQREQFGPREVFSLATEENGIGLVVFKFLWDDTKMDGSIEITKAGYQFWKLEMEDGAMREDRRTFYVPVTSPCDWARYLTDEEVIRHLLQGTYEPGAICSFGAIPGPGLTELEVFLKRVESSNPSPRIEDHSSHQEPEESHQQNPCSATEDLVGTWRGDAEIDTYTHERLYLEVEFRCTIGSFSGEVRTLSSTGSVRKRYACSNVDLDGGEVSFSFKEYNQCFSRFSHGSSSLTGTMKCTWMDVPVSITLYKQ